MLILKGKLLSIIDKAIYKNDKGMPVTSKPKIRLLVEKKRKNENLSHELHTISVPENIFEQVKNKLNQAVEIEVGSFYSLKDNKIIYFGV